MPKGIEKEGEEGEEETIKRKQIHNYQQPNLKSKINEQEIK